MHRLAVVALLALAGPIRAQEEGEAGSEGSREAPDGQALAEELQALWSEVSRQVATLKARAASGDTRGVEEAKQGLEELRDRLALLLPVEPVGKGLTPDGGQTPVVPDKDVSAALSDLRSALTLYSAEHGGAYPARLEALVPKYLKDLPQPALAQHAQAPGPRRLDKLGDVEALDAQVKDSGAWLYVSDPDSPLYGSLLLDCTHQNALGEAWFKQ